MSTDEQPTCLAIIHGNKTLVSTITRHCIIDTDNSPTTTRTISHLTARSLHIVLSQSHLIEAYYFVTAIKYLAKYGIGSLSLYDVIFKASYTATNEYRPIHRRVAQLLSACKHNIPISAAITTNSRLNEYLSSGSMKFSFYAKNGHATIAPGNRGRLTRRVIRRNLSVSKIISLILPELDDEMVNIIECLLYRL